MTFNANRQNPTVSLPSDLPFYNYGSSDIAAGVVVSVDSTNLLGVAGDGYGVVPAPTAQNTRLIGITMETIKAAGSSGNPTQSSGRVRTAGIATATADGTITAGDAVMASGSTAGRVVTQTAGKDVVGIALNSAASGEGVDVLVQPSKNS